MMPGTRARLHRTEMPEMGLLRSPADESSSSPAIVAAAPAPLLAAPLLAPLPDSR